MTSKHYLLTCVSIHQFLDEGYSGEEIASLTSSKLSTITTAFSVKRGNDRRCGWSELGYGPRYGSHQTLDNTSGVWPAFYYNLATGRTDWLRSELANASFS